MRKHFIKCSKLNCRHPPKTYNDLHVSDILTNKHHGLLFVHCTKTISDMKHHMSLFHYIKQNWSIVSYVKHDIMTSLHVRPTGIHSPIITTTLPDSITINSQFVLKFLFLSLLLHFDT